MFYRSYISHALLHRSKQLFVRIMKFLYLQRPELGRKRGRLWLTFSFNLGAKQLSRQGQGNFSFKLRQKIQKNPDFSNPWVFDFKRIRTKRNSPSFVKHCNFTPDFLTFPVIRTNMLFPRRFEKIGIPPQSKVYKVAKEMSKYFSVLIVFRFISKSKRIILSYFKIRVEMSISLKK